MPEITEKLGLLLSANAGAPFLFVGSGFSRRYIGLEQWDELLELFCTDIKDFGYYLSQNDGDLPRAASQMARDFNDVWWSADKFAQSRDEYGPYVKTNSAALKYEVSKYLSEKTLERVQDEELAEEIEALSRLNVDGVITTNWDLFLEELFPDYKVFIGQEELLFSNPQSIAEIYKIHGCASNPNSLVLTYDDYEKFYAKNAYLAAKLITLFVEHPFIFIGYSLGDPNIQSIITSIVKCLSADKLEKFGKNLIFVQRKKEGEDVSFQPSIMNIGDTNLNITVIKTNSFIDVYNAIETTKRKIPARVLRYCKEQMYELVKTTNPHGKLSVVDIDQIEDSDDVEFVVGVGIAKVQDKLSKKGYAGINLEDIFLDIFRDKSSYDADQLLVSVYPNLFKRSNKYIPAFRYLRAAGIHDLAQLRASKHAAIEKLLRNANHGKPGAYQSQYDRYFQDKTTGEIIELTTAEKAAIMIGFQADADIDLEAVKAFLLENKEKFRSEISVYATYFRKLVCLYDRIKYGFPL